MIDSESRMVFLLEIVEQESTSLLIHDSYRKKSKEKEYTKQTFPDHALNKCKVTLSPALT